MEINEWPLVALLEILFRVEKKKDTDQLGGIKLDFHFLFSVLNDWTVCFVYLLNDWTVCFVYQPSYKKQTCTIASLTKFWPFAK